MQMQLGLQGVPAGGDIHDDPTPLAAVQSPARSATENDGSSERPPPRPRRSIADVFDVSNGDSPGRRRARPKSCPPAPLPTRFASTAARSGNAASRADAFTASRAASRDEQADWPHDTLPRSPARSPPLSFPHTAEQLVAPVGALLQKKPGLGKAVTIVDGLQMLKMQRVESDSLLCLL